MSALTWADEGGGIYANPELSMQLNFVASKESRFFDIVTDPGDNDVALGKNHGDTVGCKQWGRIIDATATTALSETVPIPYVTIPEYTRQATVYQRGRAVAWTGQREDLSRLQVESPVVHALKEHSSRTHNKLIYDAAVASRSFTYAPTSATAGSFRTDGTVVSTAAAKFNGYHARQITKNLRKYNTPAFDGTNYAGIISPTMKADLFDDTTAITGFVDVKKYTSEADGLLNGEIGTYFGVRYMEDNDVLGGTLDAIGSGSAFGSGLFFGMDGVIQAPVYPMELRANLNVGGDFGRQKALAWISLLGYLVMWVYSTNEQGTILHYTSA